MKTQVRSLLFLFTPLITLAASVFVLPAHGQPENPEVLASRLSAALASNDHGSNTTALGEDLIKLGDSALPSIKSGLESDDPVIRSFYVWVAGRMRNSKDAQLVVLHQALHDRDPRVSSRAIASLMNRPPVRELSIPECDIVVRGINEDARPAATAWAGLARYVPKDPQIQRGIIDALLNRVVSNARSAGPVPPFSAYLTDDAVELSAYCNALSDLDATLVRTAASNRLGAPHSPRQTEWLLVCLGFAGETTKAKELLEIVNNQDKGSSLRAVALRGYARAAGEEAIPVLEKRLEDTTPGPQPGQFPLAIAARGELRRLREK